MTSDWLIPTLLLTPLAGSAVALLLPDQRKLQFNWALGVTVFTLLLSLCLAGHAYQPGEGGISPIEAGGMFLQSDGFNWVQAFNLRMSYGIDSISFWLILLTTILMPLIILGSYNAVGQRFREYFFWLVLLEAAMIGTFVATDIIFFYICFEFTLIPLYFLIGIYGSSQRLVASRVFFLYTFTGSMVTLAGLIYVAWFNSIQPAAAYAGAGEWTFNIHSLTAAANAMSAEQQMMVLIALLAGFAVKVPLFPFHTWLPLAHTEAPTAGSVILAGVLLKLGTYGMVRFCLPMCPEAVVTAAPVIGVLAIIGILYTALICWVQRDIKKLIAYSSVSHLGFCVLGIFAIASDNTIGQSGAVMYMVNHGLSTGALFFCVGMIYERFHTREMKEMSGLGRVMPVWATFFVFFCLASVGLPGLNGFVGEFLTLLGAFTASAVMGPWFAGVAGVGMIFAAIYILYMVGRVVFGPTKVPAHDGHGEGHADHAVKDLTGREIAVLAPLAVLCLVLGLFPSIMLKTLDKPLETLTGNAQQVVKEMTPKPMAEVDGKFKADHAMMSDKEHTQP